MAVRPGTSQASDPRVSNLSVSLPFPAFSLYQSTSVGWSSLSPVSTTGPGTTGSRRTSCSVCKVRCRVITVRDKFHFSQANDANGSALSAGLCTAARSAACVQLLLDYLWHPFEESGEPPEEFPRVREALERLRRSSGRSWSSTPRRSRGRCRCS